MATKTFEELKQLAIQIRDEKTNKKNTATRVGTAMLEHINKLEQDYYDKTQTDEELKERDDKLIELSTKNINTTLEYSEHIGYINGSGQIIEDNSYHSKVTIKYPCKTGDKFLYKGRGQTNAKSYILYKGNSIISSNVLESINKYTEITIPEGVDGIVFSSMMLKQESIPLSVKYVEEKKEKIINVGGLENNLQYFQLHVHRGVYITKDGNFRKFIGTTLQNAQGITPLLRLYADTELTISNYWNDELKQGAGVAFFNINGNLIGVNNEVGYSPGTLSISTNDLISIAPDGSVYFTLNVMGTYCTLLCNKDLSSYTDFILKDDVYSYFDLIGKGVTYTENTGYLRADGTYYDDSMYHCKTSVKYFCKPGYKFWYRGWGKSNAVSWLMYNNDKIVSNKVVDSRVAYTEILIPEGVNGIVFSSIALTENPIILDIKFGLEITDNTTNNSNVLQSEKWYCCGDSYSAGDFTNSPNPENTKFTDGAYIGLNKVYSRFIALRNGMNLQLLAECGATCGVWKEDAENIEKPTYNTNSFYWKQLPKIIENEDETFKGYITLWFCINDAAHCNLGTIDDETVATFYGALNWSALQLITKFPLAKIGFIVSNNANSQYQQAVREVAQKWAIPYLDMEGDTQIPTISGQRSEQTIPVDARVRTLRWDNTFKVAPNNNHPNEKAHEYQSTFIENWLRSL